MMHGPPAAKGELDSFYYIKWTEAETEAWTKHEAPQPPRLVSMMRLGASIPQDSLMWAGFVWSSTHITHILAALALTAMHFLLETASVKAVT